MDILDEALTEAIETQRRFVQELAQTHDPRYSKQAKLLTTMLQEARRKGERHFEPIPEVQPVARIDEVWREKPVSMHEFVCSNTYLGLGNEAFPNILRLSVEWDRPDIREGWLVAGKGSGKDFLAAMLLCRSVYIMLCYYDWRELFHLSIGDIYALNISTNEKQAQKILFTYMLSMLKRSPWFKDKFGESKSEIEFERGIRAISGHSRSTAWEGYSFFIAVLDEADFFRNIEGENVAEDLYNTAKEGAYSRMPNDYKLFVISTLRGYRSLCDRKIDEMKKIGVRRDDVLVHDRDPEDTFEFGTWQVGETMLTVAPTWVMNSRRSFAAFKAELARNPVRAGMRYGCKSAQGEESYIGQPELFESKLNRGRHHPLLPDGTFAPWFKPQFRDYFIHCDLSAKRDSTGLAVCHWEPRAEKIVVDLMLQRKVPIGGQLLIADMRRFILMLDKVGFSLFLVSFDRWQSLDTIQQLQNRGIAAIQFSVDIKAYDTFLDLLEGDSLDIYNYVQFVEEMKALVSDGKKVEHPVGGSDDVAQAVVGAVYQCALRAPQ